MSIIIIKCSICGKTEPVHYSVSNVNKLTANGWDVYGSALFCPECAGAWKKRNGENVPLWGAEQTARRIDDMYEQQYGNTVIEFCPECSTEVEMCWNVDRDGYKAFCPKCGNRLMLCDECQNRDGEIHDDCDYSSVTDSCRFNPRKGD